MASSGRYRLVVTDSCLRGRKKTSADELKLALKDAGGARSGELLS